MSLFNNFEVWEKFTPSKTEKECENSRNGHSYIAYKRIHFKCYICGKTIDRRF